jgi:Carbohydrate binding module (family 6)/PLD-like domain
MTHVLKPITLAILLTLASPLAAAAQQEWLCDPESEDCRQPIIDLIRNETRGIDVAFWFMQDDRYRTELVNRFQAGVPVRVIVDQRANSSKPGNAEMLDRLRQGGIPMREKFAGADILHFKMMLFDQQNVVQFSKANYTPSEFVPITPNVNYFDAAIFFTNDNRLTNSFRRRFEDLWMDTTAYRDFANMTSPPVRKYPLYPLDPSMNFPPLEDFSDRAVSRYNRETQAIDAIVFRVTDHRHADAMIAAVARGVPVRIIHEPTEYRNPLRPWDAKHTDRMYMGGVQIKMANHGGLAHEASVVMHGLGEVIFGSSNWTTASAFYQDEHNFFYNPTLGKPWFFQWFSDQFDRKWNDTVNYVPFQPLPPTNPTYYSPANQASGLGSSVTLTWDGGYWAHLYDIYFGTSPNPPLIESNKEIGSPEDGVRETYTVTNLLPGTTYYWRIVGKTWALLTNSGSTWSFTTAGTAPGLTPWGNTPAAIPGTFEAENFDLGGPNLAYSDTTPGNTGAVYRPSEDVDIQATTDSGGGYNVGWTKAGEWLKYTVSVAATGTYQLETRVANIGTGATFHVEVDGVDRTGPIAVPDTGAWQTFQTITTAGIPLAGGTHVIRVSFDTMTSRASVGNFNWFRLTAGSSGGGIDPSKAYPNGVPAAIPGVVQAENFDIGTEGAAYHDTSAGNAGGVYRNTDVDIGTTTVDSSGFILGWARVGEWVKYTVNVAQSRNYTLDARVANLGSGAQFRIECDGIDVTGPVSLPDTGGWDAWQTITVGNINLTQGLHILRLVMLTSNAQNNGVGNYNYFSFQ